MTGPFDQSGFPGAPFDQSFLIPVPLSLPGKEQERNSCRQNLRRHDGHPDPVHGPEKRENQNCQTLEHQRSEKRDQGRSKPVSKGSKKGRAKDRKTGTQKGTGKEPESADRQFHQIRIISGKQIRQGSGQKLSGGKHQNRRPAHQQMTLFQKPAQLFLMSCSIMITDHRRAAHRISDKHRLKDQAYIHKNPVGRDSVFPGVSHQLYIIKHADQRHGDIAHQLRGTVGAGPDQRPQIRTAV